MADQKFSAFQQLIADTFNLAGPPPGPRPAPPRMTPADRLELIADTATDIQVTIDANGDLLDSLITATEKNGDTLTDLLAVLEDIRDHLRTIADQGTRDE